MTRLRTGQKVSRVVRFLLGLRDYTVAGLLMQHGFTQEELDRGWAMVRDAAGQKLASEGPRAVDPKLLDALDKWENLWFPIASAALAHRFPETRESFFRNLAQTSGPEVVLSVGTFVRRYDALADTPAGQAARALLAERGITEAIIDEAKASLERIRTVEDGDGTDTVAMLEAQRAAEDAMWSWYLEWSTIARTVIKDHYLLRRLGYRKTRRGGETSDPAADLGAVDVDDDPDVDDGGEIDADEDVDEPVVAPSQPEVPAPVS